MKSFILSALAAACLQPALARARPPNFLFILTDDQDAEMRSIEYMPLLQKHVVQQGTLFSHHYCTVALCCPSRVNLWTGRAAHNTNVTDVVAPYGGYPKIVKQGINNDYLPVWLQSAGYNTYYVGKLWNQHSVLNYHSPHAAGFNGSDFLLDPFTYQYYSAHMSRNGGPPVSYEGQYSPDVTAGKANGFLREALERPEEPFFLVHAPVAPHADFKFVGGVEITEPKYAPRHAHLFKDYVIPRDDESFNPREQGGPAWIRDLPLLNDTVLAYNDEFQRARLRALQAVDEMVEQAVRILDEAGQLDSTYIIFTADNGYHISQHRMNPGKECGYETDVRVPFVVRGPGIAAGRVSDAVTSHTDIASTILRLAGAPPSDTDGQPIPLTQEEEAGFRAEHVTLEHWGPVIPEGKYGDYGGGFGLPHGPDEEALDESVMDFYTALRSTSVKPLVSSRNSTFKAIRVIGEQYNLYYAVWCTNETELYDHTTDPGQIRNLLSPSHPSLSAAFRLAGRPLAHVTPRLDALMLVLKSCKGATCTDPWRTLHPRGDVRSLAESLDERYDAFYDAQPRVSFARCEMGYIRDAEGPMSGHAYGGSVGWEEVGAPVWGGDEL